MDILNCRTLKQQAAEKLPNDHKRLSLIHAGIALGGGFLISLLQLFLDKQIAGTGGLAGLGTRSVLETVQMVLQYVVSIGTPFWEIGFLFVALCWIREKQAGVRSLAEGFRRFRSVLRLLLTEGLIALGLVLLCSNVGSILVSFTPLVSKAEDLLMPMVNEGYSMDQMLSAVSEMPMEEVLSAMAPALIVMGILIAVLGICLFYRFRMAHFIVMDQPRIGGMMALLLSSRMTKGHRWKLLRLDLSFWWFYLLIGLSNVAIFADVLLSKMGIVLPVSEDMAWILSYGLGCLIQLIVCWQYLGVVQTTYAAAYQQLLQLPPEQPKPQPVPQNLPWDEYKTEE